MTTKQGLHSFLFLLSGAVVLMLSLYAAHYHQLQAASPTQVAQLASNSPSVSWDQWWDRHLPGSVPYTLLRAREHMADWRSDDREQPTVTIARAQDRLLSAQYAFAHQNYDDAITTAYKSFGYLHMTWQTCQEQPDRCPESVGQETVEFHYQLLVQLEAWRATQLSDEQNVSISQLLEQTELISDRVNQIADASAQ